MGHIIFLLGMLSLVLHIECTEIAVVQSLSHVQLSVIPGTAVHQAALSMALPRQEYQSGLLRPPPRDVPDPGTELEYPALTGRFLTTEQSEY